MKTTGRIWTTLLAACAAAMTMTLPAFAQEDEEADEPVCAEILNEAELDPEDPESDELDDYVGELLEELTDEDMDTYEKVLACYDYLLKNGCGKPASVFLRR